jgi:predicted O-methyltransferase YrrM
MISRLLYSDNRTSHLWRKLKWLRAYLIEAPWYFIYYRLLPRLQLLMSFRNDGYLKQALAAKGLTNVDELRHLYRLATKTRDGCIVEIGSYCGRSTIALGLGSMASRGLPVFAIDPHEQFDSQFGLRFDEESRDEFLKNMEDAGTDHIVTLINQRSENCCKTWTRDIGLLFIDGDHHYEAVKRDFLGWERFVKTGGKIILHDTADESLGPGRVVAEALKTGRFKCLLQTKGVFIGTHRTCGITVLGKLSAA